MLYFQEKKKCNLMIICIVLFWKKYIYIKTKNLLAIICYKFVRICYAASYNFADTFHSASYTAS